MKEIWLKSEFPSLHLYSPHQNQELLIPLIKKDLIWKYYLETNSMRTSLSGVLSFFAYTSEIDMLKFAIQLLQGHDACSSTENSQGEREW